VCSQLDFPVSGILEGWVKVWFGSVSGVLDTARCRFCPSRLWRIPKLEEQAGYAFPVVLASPYWGPGLGFSGGGYGSVRFWLR
jgi:hypothetical protein